MDVSGEVADLMVKESLQITEETIKLLASGSKNLTAFLLALSQDNKKLSGKTSMSRLLRDGKELKVFHIKESDLNDFRSFGKKNVLYAVIKDNRRQDGMVDLITNVDYVSQVNHFLQSRGYVAPKGPKAEKTQKKAVPRAPQENSLDGRGSGSTASRTTKTSTETTAPTSDKPSVKGRLEMLRAASEGMKKGQAPYKQKTPPKER